jgi:ubiquinone/menaquinone biosynthesis C-methylase UbiE
MDNPVYDHRYLIIDQFTKQAVPFAKKSSQYIGKVFERIQTLLQPTENDIVLDVASGTGSLTIEFAKICRQVTGIDITPAMIEQAKNLQITNKLDNVRWDMGDITKTFPYASNSFSIVITKFSFHHLLNPLSALIEMNRVCTIGGKIVVIDPTPPPEKAIQYNQLEHLRDPSHVRSLTISEFEELFQRVGIPILKRGFYRMKIGLEDHLQTSFPDPTNVDKIRQLFIEDTKNNILGLDSHFEGNEIYFSYPNSIFVGQKA